jgi:UDP-N-acetyl-D-mannosaminuronic acid dehydrogenase
VTVTTHAATPRQHDETTSRDSAHVAVNDSPTSRCGLSTHGEADVLVVGLGYVGLTRAAGLACAGKRVVGHEIQTARVQSLAAGQPPFYEPGLGEAIASLPVGRLRFTCDLPGRLPPVTVICVGTPVDPTTKEPLLDALTTAATAVGERAREGDLVIVRSTVPVGATRRVVLPALAHLRHPRLAFSPERTIQGQALRELRELPQVIGGVDDASCDAAAVALRDLCPRQIRVSSLEAAEFVKLVNNAHTDVLYGFGNEVALMAEQLGLDATEVVGAANVDYPRPDLALPGFVGGGCLTKDPFLLVASMPGPAHLPQMVMAARRLNESLPIHVAERLCDAIADEADGPTPRVLVCGLAYKGYPPTDDVRGSAAPPVIEYLRGRGFEVVAHDYLVSARAAQNLGVGLVGLDEGFRGARGAIFLTNHPSYRTFDIRSAVATMRRPAVVVDCWGVVDDQITIASPGVRCLRLGRG